jgi:hypothetical protein
MLPNVRSATYVTPVTLEALRHIVANASLVPCLCAAHHKRGRSASRHMAQQSLTAKGAEDAKDSARTLAVMGRLAPVFDESHIL